MYAPGNAGSLQAASAVSPVLWDLNLVASTANSNTSLLLFAGVSSSTVAVSSLWRLAAVMSICPYSIIYVMLLLARRGELPRSLESMGSQPIIHILQHALSYGI